MDIYQTAILFSFSNKCFVSLRASLPKQQGPEQYQNQKFSSQQAREGSPGETDNERDGGREGMLFQMEVE